MVSFNVYRANSGGAYVEGVCLATDEKPVAGITNGSILFAVDTADGSMTRYMFDQNSATWIETECPCSGGGSGGGGDSGGGEGSTVRAVDAVLEGESPNYTSGHIDVKAADLWAAVQAGPVAVRYVADNVILAVDLLCSARLTESGYWFAAYSEYNFTAASNDEYPSFGEAGE